MSMPSATLEPQIAPFGVRNAEGSRAELLGFVRESWAWFQTLLLTCLMRRLLSGPEPAPEELIFFLE